MAPGLAMIGAPRQRGLFCQPRLFCRRSKGFAAGSGEFRLVLIHERLAVKENLVLRHRHMANHRLAEVLADPLSAAEFLIQCRIRLRGVLRCGVEVLGRLGQVRVAGQRRGCRRGGRCRVGRCGRFVARRDRGIGGGGGGPSCSSGIGQGLVAGIGGGGRFDSPEAGQFFIWLPIITFR